jgi:hypothetical protein
MKALERRLIRLGPAIARVKPPPRPPVDETRLAPDEWAEMARISEITEEAGVAALSDADLDLAICLTRKLAGEEVAPCPR